MFTIKIPHLEITSITVQIFVRLDFFCNLRTTMQLSNNESWNVECIHAHIMCVWVPICITKCLSSVFLSACQRPISPHHTFTHAHTDGECVRDGCRDKQSAHVDHRQRWPGRLVLTSTDTGTVRLGCHAMISLQYAHDRIVMSA